MDQITVAMAARKLGMSERGLRAMMSTGRISDASRAGGPAGVLASDVERVMYERRDEARRRHPDLTAFAAQVRRVIWPFESMQRVKLADGRETLTGTVMVGQDAPSVRSGRAALLMLPPDATALFGGAAVEVAAMPLSVWEKHCRWCFADASAKVFGGFAPTNTPAYRALLGADPCPLDIARWKTEADERQAASRKMAQRLAQQERAAAQSTARQEFTAAQGALQAATERTRAAARRLAAVDPAVARQAANGGRRREALTHRSRLPQCACTSETLCPKHASLLAPKPARRPGRRR